MLVAAIIAGLLALGGLALFVVVQAALTRQFDDGLASRAAALQSLTRFEHGSVEMDFAGEVMPRYQAGTDAEYFTAWVRDGNTWRVLERSESLRGGAWPARTGEPPAPGIVDDGLPDGRAGRVLTIEFRPRAEHEGAEEHEAAPTHESERTSAPAVRLLVAQSRQALDAAIRTIAISIGARGALPGKSASARSDLMKNRLCRRSTRRMSVEATTLPSKPSVLDRPAGNSARTGRVAPSPHGYYHGIFPIRTPLPRIPNSKKKLLTLATTLTVGITAAANSAQAQCSPYAATRTFTVMSGTSTVTASPTTRSAIPTALIPTAAR
jgi:hypothetical protein